MTERWHGQNDLILFDESEVRKGSQRYAIFEFFCPDRVSDPCHEQPGGLVRRPKELYRSTVDRIETNTGLAQNLGYCRGDLWGPGRVAVDAQGLRVYGDF